MRKLLFLLSILLLALFLKTGSVLAYERCSSISDPDCQNNPIFQGEQSIDPNAGISPPSPPSTDFGIGTTTANLPIAKSTVPTYIGQIINVVVAILGSILVALVIYGGVLYMTAAGNEKRVETGKTVLTYAVIGITIVFAAYIISRLVLTAVGG